MPNNKQNNLYVFVKGRKGIGAFEITDSDFKAKHKGIVKGQTMLLPYSMDLKAIEKSLEYIKNNRGNNDMPKEPVISIFTTYENNYHIASGLKNPKTEEMIQFKRTFQKLKEEFSRPRQQQQDEIKCYWIPDNFENHIQDIKNLLDKDSGKQ